MTNAKEAVKNEEARQNGGSAGEDGVSIDDMEREGVGQFLGQIEQDMKAGIYRPRPVQAIRFWLRSLFLL